MERASARPRLVVRPLTPSRWKDFEALFGPNGACAGCWCLWNRQTSARILEVYPLDTRGRRAAPAFAWWGTLFMRRLLGAALLLLGAGVAARADPPGPFPDVEPRVLRSSVTWPDPSWPYYRPDERLAAVKAFVPPGRDAYPRVQDGELLPPRLYDAEARYSKEDQARLKAALKAAHRYADVNNAAADGYLFEQKYGAGMGIHAHRLDLVFDDALDPAEPEFLTYALDRDSGRWQLLQLGYIRRGLTRPAFFDSPNAKGHFHDENICVAVVGAQLATRFASSPCAGPGERRIGPIWMMHLAVNVYNEKGLFADEFLYADHLSREGGSYSFFGRKLPGGKP